MLLPTKLVALSCRIGNKSCWLVCPLNQMKESKIDLNSTKAEAIKQIQHLRRDKAAPSCFQEFHFTVMVQRPPQDVFRLVANIAQLSSAAFQ